MNTVVYGIWKKQLELFSLAKREISQMKLEYVHLDIASFPTEIGKISFKIDYLKIVNFKWNKYYRLKLIYSIFQNESNIFFELHKFK